ncbi:MAG TPA: PIG-L family deacetylase [Ignavibacteriaceae bacterium]|nr:PIG-L family deacetylase [Ignavibacteriaceae bacterium]
MLRSNENQSEHEKKLNENTVDPNTIFHGKILIFVPHMDDEILSCGGTIAQIKNKNSIYFIFATDGKQSPYSKETVNVDLNKIRTNESKTALKSLGIPLENISFLNFPERKLKKHFKDLTSQLRHIINEINPDFILTPFRFDRHPDHLALSKASFKAFLDSNSKAELFEYFVYIEWQLLKYKDIRLYIKPDLLVKINTDKVTQLKRAAFEFFESQTKIFFRDQNRPILPEDFLDNNCRLPEFFLKTDLKSDNSVFNSSKLWIMVAHAIEPSLKYRKDKFLSFVYRIWKR